METIFFGDDGKIRVGWRFAVFLITFFLISAPLVFASIIVLAQLPFGQSPTGFLPLVLPFTISSVIAIALGWGFGKMFEDLPFRALGISLRGDWLKNFAIGCVIGAVAIGSAVLIAVVGGGIKLTVNRESAAASIATSLATTFVIFFIGALSEEVLCRGYLLQTFVRSHLTWVGAILTSLLFALGHLGNESVSKFPLINTFLAGIWFSVAYLKTRDLWLPFGIHFIWNWLQGPFFGINVSGYDEMSAHPILRATDSGPAWLTGGSYGIEGGIACTIAILISIGLIYFLPGLKPDSELLALSESRQVGT